MTRLHIHFTGQVQGVGFRYTTARLACGFAVTGFVRNLPDGRVELVVEGSRADVQKLLSDVGDAMEGHIRQTNSTEAAATGEFASFEIRN